MLSHFFRKLRDTLWPLRYTFCDRGTYWHATPAGKAVLPHIGDAGGVVVKENLQRTITRYDTPTEPVYVKVCRVNTPRAFARELLRPAKARLEFENAVELRRRGILTVEPLAWGTRRRWWPSESVIVTREAVGARDFLAVLEASPSPGERASWRTRSPAAWRGCTTPASITPTRTPATSSWTPSRWRSRSWTFTRSASPNRFRGANRSPH